MNTNDQAFHRQAMIYLMMVSFVLSGLLLPALAYSEKKMEQETATISNSSIQYNDTQSTIQNSPVLQEKNTARKNKTDDDSRGLSAFFILGIVINILMAVTFTWWFTKEWRKSK